MPKPFDQTFEKSFILGDRRGWMTPISVFARIVEPFYAGAVLLRNRMFDSAIRKSRRLPRPVISIGNITTGGTGKTPVIRWLASRLRDEGQHVCILSRGYKAPPGELGDELTMLGQLLNQPGKQAVKLRANPSRFAAGDAALNDDPSIDAFLLDDGFQHRQLARDFDIVLISAYIPFGLGHVLPAGLLREPLRGLRRAGAFVITHADQVSQENLSTIERTIRSHNATAPIVRAAHALRGFRSARASSTEPVDIPLSALIGRKWLPFCGIANPLAFSSPLAGVAGQPVGAMSFDDHHHYTEADLLHIRKHAVEHGANVLVTTEKDWVKIARFPIAFDEKLPVWRTEMQIEFQDDGEGKLLDAVRACLRSARAVG